MLALLSPIDYGVLALFLAILVGMGAYFSARQKDSREFFLAGRSLGWLPLGMSLTAIFVSMLTITALPGQAVGAGWKCAIVVLPLWLVLPVVAFLVIPIYRGLGVVSLYEYLELRFDPSVRLLASLIFVAWRLVWLAGVIYFPCEAIRVAAGWNMPLWLLVVPVGAVATLIAFLGGLRSVTWSGIVKSLAMFGGALVVMIGVWLSLSGGPQRVAEITSGLGRLEPVELEFAWTDPWTLWGALPFWLVTVLTFFVADQVAVQRLLSAKSENAARTAYLCSVLALSLLLPMLVYVGTCLLAFYYDHPQEMRPEWVVNVDGKTREPVLGSDNQPLLDPSNPAHAVTFENIDRLVSEGRILQPNSKEPFTTAEGLVDPETNRVLVEKLAMRRPNNDRLRGEIIVRKDAPEQMLPRFAQQRLGWGAAGLLLAALLAASLAAIDAGLNSLCTIMVQEFVLRFGWGRKWLARRQGKEPAELSSVDELQLARPMTLVLGIAATLAAAIAGQFAGIFGLVVGISSALGAPLLAICLLGMVTRQTSAAGARIAAAGGVLFTLGLAIFGQLAEANILVPANYRFADIWPAIAGFVFTIVLGYATSLVLGRRKSNAELRGLVAGCGELGRRATDEAIPLISLPEDASDEIRWK